MSGKINGSVPVVTVGGAVHVTIAIYFKAALMTNKQINDSQVNRSDVKGLLCSDILRE